jgi:di/tricarboxylate transporter
MAPTGFDYKKERAGLSLTYGIELDETSSSILFAEQSRKLGEATSKISNANNSLQVDSQSPRQQAFWFGMGKWGFALFFALSIASCFYMYYLSKEEQRAKMPALLNWYRAYYDISQKGSKKAAADFLKQHPLPE